MIISVYTINWFVCVMQVQYVYCKVQNEFVSIIYVKFMF